MPPPEIAVSVDRFLEAVLLYQCIGRVTRVSRWRVLQALCDSLYREKLWSRQVLLTGSHYEGMIASVCDDVDIMVCKRLDPVVLHQCPPHDLHHRSSHDLQQRSSHDLQQRPSHDLHQCPSHDLHQCPSHDLHQCLSHDIHQCPSHDLNKCPPYDLHHRPPHDLDKYCDQSSSRHPPVTVESQLTHAEYVIAKSNPDQPAYLNLFAPDGATNSSSHLAQMIVEYNGLKYVSSGMFVADTVHGEVEVKGPSGRSLIFTQNPDLGMADRVPCLYSPSWPPCAQEFFLRPRSHSWPPQSLLRGIQQSGCHVVGVGHPSSERRDLEWRWSFSTAERELIQQMSTEMACSMCLLKGIKTRIWKTEMSDDQPNTVCSYFLKVACLWTAEELREQTANVMDQTMKVLNWLIECYQRHTLPHYFIPEQNLIGHLPADTCMEVVDILIGVRASLWVHVLCSMEMDSNLAGVLRSVQNQLGISPVADYAPDVDDNAPKVTDNAPKVADDAPKVADTPKVADNAPKDADNAPKDADNAPKDVDNAPKVDAYSGVLASHEDGDSERDGWPLEEAQHRQGLTTKVHIESQVDINEFNVVAKPTPEDNYRQLLTALLGCDKEKAARVLEEASHLLEAGGEMCTQAGREYIGTLGVLDFPAMHKTLRCHSHKARPSDLLPLPDRIILPIINNLPSIVDQGHVETFRTALYRLLGDVYISVHKRYQDLKEELPAGFLEACYHKSQVYFTEGITMRYPDGWTDPRLSGYVQLATLYCVNKEWGKLEGVLDDLNPLLEEAKRDSHTVNALPNIVLDSRIDLTQIFVNEEECWHHPLTERRSGSSAKVIECSHHPLTERRSGSSAKVNSVVLGYYFKGVLALTQGRREVAVEAFRHMEQVRCVLWNFRQSKSTPVLIDTLSAFLAE